MKNPLKTIMLLGLMLIIVTLTAIFEISDVHAVALKQLESASMIDETYEEVRFLPVILFKDDPEAIGSRPRINIPYFETETIKDKYSEMAVAWFGKVGPVENYADIRAGYNEEGLVFSLNIIDRIQWYDTHPSPDDLTNWDAVTLFLDLDSNLRNNPGPNSYQFVTALNHFEPRENYQASYRGNSTVWELANIPFSTTAYYRGEGGLNNNGENRGWWVNINIPFTSLGLSNPPVAGTLWKLGISMHDRDDAVGALINTQKWPDGVDGINPSSWGELRFGLVNFSPPSVAPSGEITIRNKLNGIFVPDVAVGGTIGNLCPGNSYHIWNVWGFANYAYAKDFNTQNQSDVADWPCFAKYYITFPLGSLPRGKVIISAKLILYQFGNAGNITDPDPSNRPRPSLIQVLRVPNGWEETTLTWNNAPLALENVSQAWVNPLEEFPAWPGVAREWDVSYAVTQAYSAGEPLNLALYEADAARHSGKYFSSSNTGDWNENGRPTLVVTWGEP